MAPQQRREAFHPRSSHVLCYCCGLVIKGPVDLQSQVAHLLSSHRLGQAPRRFYPLTSLHWFAYLGRALYRCLYERERRCQNLFMTVRSVHRGFCIEKSESAGPSYRDITHLFITGGGDTGFCLFLTSVLILRLPEPAFTEEPLVQFQLITGFFPTHTAFYMQSVNIDCDILNVFRRNPGPMGSIGRCS